MISLSCCLATVLHDVSQTSTLPGRTGRGRHFARVDGYRTTTTEKRTTYFYHTDHLGSTVLVTDENGATVWSTEYTPFGSLTFAEGKLKRAAKFTGKDLDEDTGLYYFNARWYDSEIGRFISEDPIKDGVNWYTYAANNPLRFVDPMGLFTDEVTAALSLSASIDPIGTLGVVESGDSLESIAKDKYGDEKLKSIIIEANGLDPENPEIEPGRVLYIPNIEPVYDNENKLQGYQYIGVINRQACVERNQKLLEYKHKQGMELSSGRRYAIFGSIDGSISSDAWDAAVVGGIVIGGKAVTSSIVAKIVGSGTKGIVLWSGGEKIGKAAAEFAKQNNLKTLEQTFTGKVLNFLKFNADRILGKDRSYKLLRPLWEKASARFANSASGTVHVFLNPSGISETSIFMTVEYPIIKQKGVEIIFHLR